MKMEMCLVICFLVGVLVFYLLKQSCGCKTVEGQQEEERLFADLGKISEDSICDLAQKCGNGITSKRTSAPCTEAINELKELLATYYNITNMQDDESLTADDFTKLELPDLSSYVDRCENLKITRAENGCCIAPTPGGG
jgi:hypothetical protein